MVFLFVITLHCFWHTKKRPSIFYIQSLNNYTNLTWNRTHWGKTDKAQRYFNIICHIHKLIKRKLMRQMYLLTIHNPS